MKKSKIKPAYLLGLKYSNYHTKKNCVFKGCMFCTCIVCGERLRCHGHTKKPHCKHHRKEFRQIVLKKQNKRKVDEISDSINNIKISESNIINKKRKLEKVNHNTCKLHTCKKDIKFNNICISDLPPPGMKCCICRNNYWNGGTMI